MSKKRKVRVMKQKRRVKSAKRQVVEYAAALGLAVVRCEGVTRKNLDDAMLLLEEARNGLPLFSGFTMMSESGSGAKLVLLDMTGECPPNCPECSCQTEPVR